MGPSVMLYFAGVFTKNKSNLKILLFSIVWSVFAYIGTIIGEYLFSIGKIMFSFSGGYSLDTLFFEAKQTLDNILLNQTGFKGILGQAFHKFYTMPGSRDGHLLHLDNYLSRYGSIYIEATRITMLVLCVVLVSNYFLSGKKYISFNSKSLNINMKEDMKSKIYYRDVFFYGDFPQTIRPNIFLYLIAPSILIPCVLFVFYTHHFQTNLRVIYFMSIIILAVSAIFLLIMEFSQITFNDNELVFHQNFNLKKTKLSYNQITMVHVETKLGSITDKNIVIYTKDNKKYLIALKFFLLKKQSLIVRMLIHKCPDIKINYEAEALNHEKHITKTISTTKLINFIMCFMMLNLIATIILCNF